VNPGLVGLAVAVVAAGVVAVSARDGRVATIGLALAGVLAPLIADPVPTPLPLAARIVAAILVAYLFWIVFRADVPTRGSAIGWPADALIAAACAIAGASAARIGSAAIPGLGDAPNPAASLIGGPPEALMAGFALAALSAGPLIGARDAYRLAVGMLLAVLAAALVRAGLAGTAPPLEALGAAGLTAVLGAAAAIVAATGIRIAGGLTLDGSRPAGARPARPAARHPFRLPEPVRRSTPGPAARPMPPATAAVHGPRREREAAEPGVAATEPGVAAAEPGVAAAEPGPEAEPQPSEPTSETLPRITPRSSGTRRLPGR
jgi:hypothetical protein